MYNFEKSVFMNAQSSLLTHYSLYLDIDNIAILFAFHVLVKQATGLSWLILELLSHRQCMQRIVDEVTEVFGE